MCILGIHGWDHDIAAALFDDYNLIARTNAAGDRVHVGRGDAVTVGVGG
jgi:hypothetical protein